MIEYKESKEIIQERFIDTISSILENRLTFIFLPTKNVEKTEIFKKFKENNNEIEFKINDYVTVIISNVLLTQAHKSFLEAMLSYEKYKYEDESFFVRFNLYNLLAYKLNIKNIGGYYELYDKYLKDIAKLKITIKIEYDKYIYEENFSFINEYQVKKEINKKTKKTKNAVYRVEFNKNFAKILKNEHLIKYLNNGNIINTITNREIQAIVKYLITFDKLTISLKKLLENLKFNEIFKKRTYYKKIAKIREDLQKDENKKLLEIYGITYDKEKDNLIIERNKDNIYIKYSSNKENLSSAIALLSNKK